MGFLKAAKAASLGKSAVPRHGAFGLRRDPKKNHQAAYLKYALDAARQKIYLL
jgi:hypothetical protein